MTEFGDRVRIKATKETERLSLAGREGIIYGWTTPSVTNVPIVGPLVEDYAVNVHFADENEGHWFANELVEFVDHAAGGVMSYDCLDFEWVRQPDGEWQRRSKGAS